MEAHFQGLSMGFLPSQGGGGATIFAAGGRERKILDCVITMRDGCRNAGRELYVDDLCDSVVGCRLKIFSTITPIKTNFLYDYKVNFI